ncbi:TauD/TfdA-like domain-containing protein [Plasmodiophora brassicae]|uniref:TauD/TfdA-like domain-containing protein n=1 Tax=Plasmodiophora brassicae TaxID=37360 RepID=A0A0G4J2R0_PLABS|nr:hypothetical protein PBRA_008788 [Plasmodiophora brassicae]SPQ96583.1 unnamed protein product [Plasmodiophora brassicae]
MFWGGVLLLLCSVASCGIKAMPNRQHQPETSQHRGVRPPPHDGGHAQYRVYAGVPYASVRSMKRSAIAGVKCYEKNFGELFRVILEDLGQPETAAILTSFESHCRRGFSFISLPGSVMEKMNVIKASDTVNHRQLIELGMAVQESIQEELENSGRGDWIAVATRARPRTSGAIQEADRVSLSPGNLVHMDYRRQATLLSLLNEGDDFMNDFQFRLATSPIFKYHDNEYGSGNVERADEILELMHTINVWAPIVDVVRSQPLALMSADSLVAGQAKPCLLGDCNAQLIVSQVVCPTEDGWQHNKWYWKNEMAFGQAFVFDSRRTPHCAVPVEDPSHTRKSVEIRVLIMKPRIPDEMRSSPRQPCWTEAMLRVATVHVFTQLDTQASRLGQFPPHEQENIFLAAADLLRQHGYPDACPETPSLHDFLQSVDNGVF